LRASSTLHYSRRVVDAVEPLSPGRWRDLEDLFGVSGAYGGCWCMFWRLKRPDWEKARGSKAKALFQKRVERGPAPGVIAYVEGEAVGWLQIGPRADAPQWNNPRRLSAPLPDAPATDETVWAANCFFVKKGWRGKGVTKALLNGAIDLARRNGARMIEACPFEADGRIDSGSLYVGHAAIFKRAGFKEVARRKDNRPLMRLDLSPVKTRASTSSKARGGGA
jgi:predicted GNAT family acetyltransferase